MSSADQHRRLLSKFDVDPDKVKTDFFGLDWFPTFVAAVRNPNIADELLKSKKTGYT